MDKAAELKAEYGKAKLEANNAQEDEDVRVVFFFSSLCVCVMCILKSLIVSFRFILLT